MKQALGLVEVSGLSTAVVTADTMVKAANVEILGIENTKGLGYITIKVSGDVGAVTASVNAGCQTALETGKLVSRKVIARPADYVETMFCKLEADPAEADPASLPQPEPEPAAVEPEPEAVMEESAVPPAEQEPAGETTKPEPAETGKKNGTAKRKK